MYSEEGRCGGEECSCHGSDPGKFVQIFLALNFSGNIIVKLHMTSDACDRTVTVVGLRADIRETLGTECVFI